MNSQQPTARRIGMAIVAACSLLLTSCAAGQHAATARQTPPIDGVNGTVGNLEIRAVAIVPPPDGASSYQSGGAAALTVSIVNNGVAGDSLTGISTPAATSWGVFDNAAAASAALGTGSASASPSASSSASASASTSESASSSSTSPSGSLSATVTPGSATPAGASSVDLPPGQSTSFGVPSAKRVLMLIGLTAQLYPATSVSVTFTFAKAGSLTLMVPVQLSTSPAESTVPAPSSGA